MGRLTLFPHSGERVRRDKIRGIKAKWMTNSLLFVVLVALLGVVAFSVAISSYYYSGIRTSLETKAKTATSFFANYISRTYAEYYQSAYRYTEIFDERDRLELQFINASGRIEVSTYGLTAGTMPGTADIRQALETQETSPYMGRDPVTGERIIAVSSPLTYSGGRTIGVIRYVSSLKLVDRQVAYHIAIAVGIGTALVLFVFVTNLIFIRSIVTPIQEVTVMTRHIADGGYGSRIENKYQDELGEMVAAINEMSMQISRSDKVKTEFISSVSHELRTPLTAITGWGETLQYDESLSEDSRRGLDIILRNARSLTNMVEELLVFTRIEDGRFTVNIEELDLSAELEEIVFTYQKLLRQEGIRLEYEQPDEPLPLISGDPDRLKQVFLNLIDNAAKHGGSGKRIVVSIASAEKEPENRHGFVCVRVRDFGPGIPPDDLPNVKLKFYKANSKTRGSGIGLAVCDEIVQRHGGSVAIENAPGGGALVTVLLPVAGSA